MIHALLVAMALCMACTPTAVMSQPEDIEVTSTSGGMSMMLACVADHCRYDDSREVFQLQPGDPLHAELGFVQWFSEAKPFRVFLLLNYRQALFTARPVAGHEESGLAPVATPITALEANGPNNVLEFTAPPERELYFDLRTESLAPGYYDLALIAVPDPDANQRELSYWTTAQFAIRRSIYVGDAATPPTFAYPLVDPTPAPDSGFSELLWFGREPHNTRLKGEQRVAPGEEVTLLLNYQPYAGNLADAAPPDTPLPVAFVAFIDDRVVPLNDQPVLYASALPNRLSSFPVTVRVPDAPGIHQIFIQQFPNPYVDPKVAEETGRELFGISSQRFILDAG